MKLLGKEFTQREAGLVLMMLLLLLGYLLNVWAAEKTIVSYQNAYVECMNNINEFNTGYSDVWGRPLEVLNETNIK
jgi:hypothetical protein